MRNIWPRLLTGCMLALLAGISLQAEERRKSSSSTHKKPAPETPRPKSESGGFRRTTPKPVPDDAEPATPKPRSRKTPESDSPTTPEATPAPKREHPPSATIEPENLAEFAAQPQRIQDLFTKALDLTKLNLTYTYGSADPAQGGMDCSGTIYHLLSTSGFKEVPRDSGGQYAWVRKAGQFFAVVSRKADSFEFSDLKPGDLMFWTGTYQTGRDIPISHVMLYLGTEKKRKQRVMFGSSDGRSYDGVQRWGVSVFDFKMPRTDEGETQNKPGPTFVGYGRIPGLRGAVEAVAAAPVEVSKEGEATPTPAPKAKKKSSKKRE